MGTKKKSRATTKKLQESPLLARLPKNDIEYLERLIETTEKNITSQGTTIDEFFKGQAERLKRQLAELRKKSAVS